MARERQPQRDPRPVELMAFRLADWQHPDDAQAAAADPEAADLADRASLMVAAAYGRYKAARKQWAASNGYDELAQMLDRREHRLAEWTAAQQQAMDSITNPSRRGLTS